MTGIDPSNASTEVSADDFEVPAGARSQWTGLLIGVLVISLAALFVADRMFNPEEFQIKEIKVLGRFDQIDGALVKQKVEAALEGNYFSVSLYRLENEIRQIPWVFSASLRRQWPSTIVVEVVEVQPVAKWGENKWLNFTGDLVDRQPGSNQETIRDLPILNGLESDRQIVWNAFQQWSERFSSRGLSLDELRLGLTGLWHLKLSLGALSINSDQSNAESGEPLVAPSQVTMVVGKTDAFLNIERFIKVLDQELIIQFPEMKSIDLRYPNGFAISWVGSGPVSQNLTESGFEQDNKTNTGFE